MTRHTAGKVPGAERAGQSGTGTTGHARRTRARVAGSAWASGLPAILTLAVLALASACGGGASPDASATSGPLALGIDVLFRDSLHRVAGKRVGLITNQTGVSWPADRVGRDDADPRPPAPTIDNAVSTIDRLAASPDVELVALFSPEHGIRGRAREGQAVSDSVDLDTGLPIHSLYGATRKPTPEMLDGIDVLVFDIQDIGARYYTYVWTMALAMEAAGEAGIRFVVLDRPNPLGGELVQGDVLDPDFATFVGLYPVPMRHGLTAGELARMLVGEFGIDVDLTVVPMDGWTRRTWWVQTGLPFIPPSPNMPSVGSATHYPGTCLFEGTNLSVGRGTDRPFQWIGAPWLDAETLAARLNAMVRDAPSGDDATANSDHPMAGFYAQATTFTPDAPSDGKFAGQEVHAVRFELTDPRTYDPTLAAVAALTIIQELHADRLEWNVAHFDRLAGTDALREGIIAGESVGELTADWASQLEEFRSRRAPYLLY